MLNRHTTKVLWTGSKRNSTGLHLKLFQAMCEGWLCLFTCSNSVNACEPLKLHFRALLSFRYTPGENSLQRQNRPRTRFRNIPLCLCRTSLETPSQGRDKHLVFEYYFNSRHTARVKKRKFWRTLEARSCCWASICCCCLAAISCSSARVMSMRGVATWRDHVMAKDENKLRISGHNC